MASGVTAHNSSAFQQNDLHTGTQNEQVKTVPSGQHLAEAWLATPLGLNSRLFSDNCLLSERLLALPTRQCKGPSGPRSTLSVAPLLWSPQPRIQSVWSCVLIFDPIMPHTQQLLFSPPKLNTSSRGGRWKMSGLGRWWHMRRAEQRERNLPDWLWFIHLGRGTH